MSRRAAKLHVCLIISGSSAHAPASTKRRARVRVCARVCLLVHHSPFRNAAQVRGGCMQRGREADEHVLLQGHSGVDRSLPQVDDQGAVLSGLTHRLRGPGGLIGVPSPVRLCCALLVLALPARTTHRCAPCSCQCDHGRSVLGGALMFMHTRCTVPQVLCHPVLDEHRGGGGAYGPGRVR